MNNKLDDTISKAMGAVKENTGKMVKSEATELKGKMQRMGGNMTELGEEAVKNTKERLAGKANDFLEEYKSKR
ncbi:MAG: hypothetical protein PHW03_02015 [Eubacteriales bacterium]|nr:hypothetical protein [Eubacteriales bacterium]MDD4389559.1 hypothetical protein [Eubacteriales bacterium]